MTSELIFWIGLLVALIVWLWSVLYGVNGSIDMNWTKKRDLNEK